MSLRQHLAIYNAVYLVSTTSLISKNLKTIVSATIPAKKCRVAKDAVNRWTDNTWQCKSHCVKKLGQQRKDMDKYFEINDKFDYVN